MEALLARLLVPLVLLLVVGAAGIAVLVADYRKSRDVLPERPASPRSEQSARPLATLPESIPRPPVSPPRSGPAQETLRIRTGPRDTAEALPKPRLPAAATPPPGPFRTPDPLIPAGDDPPTVTTRAARTARLMPVGANIVVNTPTDPEDYLQLPGKLEVIYGNFSPSDPREMLFYTVSERTESPRYVFSKKTGDTVYHFQLNHYTVTPGTQAALTFEQGRHVLVNTVPEEEMDRYQTRINGIPMAVNESHVLVPGDIISLGIYRLKLVL